MRKFTFVLCCVLLAAGCSQTSSAPPVEESKSPETVTVRSVGNPRAEDILAKNPQADIFQFGDIVYKNASDIEWVQERELTPGDHIGTIQKQYKDGQTFENEMAVLLPAGAEIYEPFEKSGSILIVKLNGKELRYLGLIEG